MCNLQFVVSSQPLPLPCDRSGTDNSIILRPLNPMSAIMATGQSCHDVQLSLQHVVQDCHYIRRKQMLQPIKPTKKKKIQKTINKAENFRCCWRQTDIQTDSLWAPPALETKPILLHSWATSHLTGQQRLIHGAFLLQPWSDSALCSSIKWDDPYRTKGLGFRRCRETDFHCIYMLSGL